MKCSRCPALACIGYEYPEEYCAVGGYEECPEDWADGESGCRLHPQTVRKRLRDSNLDDRYFDCGEFYKSREYKGKGIDVDQPGGLYMQMARHCIGLDRKWPYKRHGEVFHKAYRNHYAVVSGSREHDAWEILRKIGYAAYDGDNIYWLTASGLRWIARVLKIKRITEEGVPCIHP